MNRIIMFAALSALALVLGSSMAGAKSEDLSVMTFNVHGSAVDESGDFSWVSRKKGCLKAIKKFDPDVIFLQEAFAYHKADLIKEFKKHMLVDRSAKPGTVDQAIQNNENPIMFRADKFELLDYGSFWLNEDQTEDKVGWDAVKPRNATWIKLRYKKSGVIFFCFNTQFDPGDVSGKKSSELLSDKVKEIAGVDANVIVGGDFAMSSSDKAITTLTSFVKDANYSLKKPDTRASFNGFGKTGSFQLWPDHVFFRKAKPTSYEVVDSKKFGPKFISNHYPVYAEFEIPIPKGK